MTFRLLNNAALVGIGYIIGLRYSAIIAAGSFLSYFVLVPMVHAIGSHLPDILPPGAKLISAMTPDQVFRSYVRIIGVGGIAGAGIMGVASSVPSMVRSIVANLKGLKSQDRRAKAEVPRVDRSLSGSFVAVGLVVFAIAALLFFSFGIGLKDSLVPAFVGTALVMAIAFLFAPVAARAIAIIGTNPVSGMTMLTLIITGFVMLKLGLSGGMGMFVTMMVGGVVCTALAASGALSSDLKIGHWLGATPARQLGLKFVGTAVAATFCGLAMWVMAQADPSQGFGTNAIPAPQASAMKEILVGIFGATTAPLQWYLFGLGVLLSLILRMVGVPALAFALGMYLPIELNTSVLLGGILSWVVARRAKAGEGLRSPSPAWTAASSSPRASWRAAPSWASWTRSSTPIIKMSTGTMEAKGVVHLLSDGAFEGALGDWLAMAGLAGLCAFLVLYARRAEPEGAPS